jgi:hypothetical protein
MVELDDLDPSLLLVLASIGKILFSTFHFSDSFFAHLVDYFIIFQVQGGSHSKSSKKLEGAETLF